MEQLFYFAATLWKVCNFVADVLLGNMGWTCFRKFTFCVYCKQKVCMCVTDPFIQNTKEDSMADKMSYVDVTFLLIMWFCHKIQSLSTIKKHKKSTFKL